MLETNGVPKNLIENVRNGFLAYDEGGAATYTLGGKSWSASSKEPIFGCPDQQWEQYAEAFAATDIDRMVMEESAKVSGRLSSACRLLTTRPPGRRIAENDV
jgi:hypothetical protein